MIGNNRHDQYCFDEEYTRKDSLIKNNKGNLEVATDADIIIIPDMRCSVELAFLIAAIRTGKTVYTEMYGRSVNLAKDKLRYWIEEYGHSLNVPDRIEYEFSRYVSEVPDVNIKATSDNIPSFDGLPNLDDVIVFHECTKEDYAPKEVKEVVHSGLEKVDFHTSGANIIFGAHPEEFNPVFEKMFEEFIKSGEYSSYASYSSYRGDTRNKQTPRIPKKYEQKSISTYFNDKDFVTATTDADVIVIPLINNHQAMGFLKIALATGVPVFAGFNACNSQNAHSLLHFLDMGSKVLNAIHDIAPDGEQTAETASDFEGWVTDEINTYATCEVSDEGIALVKWLM